MRRPQREGVKNTIMNLQLSAVKLYQVEVTDAVVKVADDVRGHSTDSLIHKDHVDVVTVALIHFVALIHG